MRIGSNGCLPAFSGDGRYFAIGCNDGTIKIWDVALGTLHSSLDRGCHTYVHSQKLFYAAIRPFTLTVANLLLEHLSSLLCIRR